MAKSDRLSVLHFVAFGVVLAGLAYFGGGRSDETTPQMVEDNLRRAAFGNPTQVKLQDVLSSDFPREYDMMLAAMADLINASPSGASPPMRELEAIVGAAMQDLYAENAHFLKSAPVDDIRNLAQATYDLLSSTSEDPEACVTVLLGLANANNRGTSGINSEKLANLSLARLGAIAAGRDRPFVHAEVSQEDIARVMFAWATLPETTEGLKTALLTSNASHPDFCVANLSFQGFVLQNTDPATERVMVALTVGSVVQ